MAKQIECFGKCGKTKEVDDSTQLWLCKDCVQRDDITDDSIIAEVERLDREEE